MATEVQVLLPPLKGGHPPADDQESLLTEQIWNKNYVLEIQVKAGGKRISKKQDIGVLERQSKKSGLEKTSAIANAAKIQTLDVLNDTLDKLNHKFPATVHTAHQKPTPALEKVAPLKRIYIIQQPRKC